MKRPGREIHRLGPGDSAAGNQIARRIITSGIGILMLGTDPTNYG